MKESKKRKQAVSDQRFTAVMNLMTAVLFFGTIIFLGLATVFSEKEDFSETQNRKLASFPKISGKNIYSGRFMSGVEDYVSDHLAGGDGWIKAKTLTELAAGKKDGGGVYILKDRLVEKIPEPDMARADKSIEGIRKFAEDNNISPLVMIVPTQAEIYSEELPPNAPNPNQQEYISYVYGALEDCAVTVDVCTVLSANRSSYIYYRTDHHWTTRGAFLAYTAAAKKMGVTALTESCYDIEHASDSFRGTFYSKVLYDGIKPDSIDIWLPAGEQANKPQLEIYSAFGEEPAAHSGLYFREYLDVKDKYSTFFGTNQPMITVKTGNKGERLLIFKDSYAHSLVPFLVPHYSEITMADLRYIQTSYKDMIDVSRYDTVMFLYNASTFMSDDNLKKLGF